MTGIVSAILTAFGITLVMFGVIAALAFADAPSAVAAAAGLISAGLAGLGCEYLRRRLARRRFRYPRPGSPRHGLRLLPPWEWQIRVTQLRGEARAARPQWTTAELAALDDEASLEQLLGRLPEARRERRLR